MIKCEKEEHHLNSTQSSLLEEGGGGAADDGDRATSCGFREEKKNWLQGGGE